MHSFSDSAGPGIEATASFVVDMIDATRTITLMSRFRVHLKIEFPFPCLLRPGHHLDSSRPWFSYVSDSSARKLRTTWGNVVLDAKPILAGNLPTVGSSLPTLSFDKVSHERARYFESWSSQGKLPLNIGFLRSCGLCLQLVPVACWFFKLPTSRGWWVIVVRAELHRGHA